MTEQIQETGFSQELRSLPIKIKDLQEIREGESILYQYDLAIDLISLERQGVEMQVEEREVIKTLDGLSLRVWSGRPLAAWEGAIDKNTCVVLLSEGLASNHEQWTNPGCSFVPRFHEHLGAKIRSQLGEEGENTRVVCIAVSCPGFGGSRIKEELFGDDTEVNADLVSDERYAYLLNAVSKILRIKQSDPLAYVAVGHSAGGEAVFRWWQNSSELSECPAVVALNPSLGLEKQRVFELIKKASGLGKTTRRVGELVDRLVRGVGRLSNGVVNGTEEEIIKFLTGLKGKTSSAMENQKNSHLDELRKNPEAFEAKLTELKRPDKFDPKQTEQALSVNRSMPLMFYGSRDALTKPCHTEKWLEFFLASSRKRLEEIGLSLLARLDRIGDQGQALAAYLEKQVVGVVEKISHDAVFVDPRAQDKAFELIERQVEPQVASRWPVVKEIRAILKKIKDSGLPVKIELALIGGERSLLKKANNDYCRALREGPRALADLIYRQGKPPQYSSDPMGISLQQELLLGDHQDDLRRELDEMRHVFSLFYLRQLEVLCDLVQCRQLVKEWKDKIGKWEDNEGKISVPAEEAKKFIGLLSGSFAHRQYLASKLPDVGNSSSSDENLIIDGHRFNDGYYDVLHDAFYEEGTPTYWLGHLLTPDSPYSFLVLEELYDHGIEPILMLFLFDERIGRKKAEVLFDSLINQDIFEVLEQRKEPLTITIPITAQDLNILNYL